MERRSVVGIMTVHNRAHMTRTCLERYFAFERPGLSLSAVVVDDGSGDETGDLLRRDKRVLVVQGTGSLYWAAGMALAESVARTQHPDFLLWLNNDVLLHANAVDILLEVSDLQSAAIVVGSTIEPTSRAVTYGGFKRRRGFGMSFVRVAPAPKPQLIDAFNGNIVLVAKVAYEALGGIDGGFAHSMADLDYGLRAKVQGLSPVLAPGVQGDCTNDHRHAYLEDPQMSFRARIRSLEERKNVPISSRLRFLKRHCRFAWPAFVLSPYVRIAVRHLQLQRKTARRE